MRLTEYHTDNEKINKSLRLAVISDLHGCDPREALDLLEAAKADYILAPGDIFERVDGGFDDANEKGFMLLESAAKLAPTFYSEGNHEIGGTRSWALGLRLKRPSAASWSEEGIQRLCESGVRFLDNNYVLYDGLCFGGLSSGILNDARLPKLEWLDAFCADTNPKILLCHHPEYYEKYLTELDIDLIVSGHAHGGQWSFFGRGVFAPGQGMFPKYTSGIYDNRLAVSRGMKKGKLIPRLFNPTEVMLITVN